MHTPPRAASPAPSTTTPFDDPRITAMGLLVEVYTGLMDRLSPQLGEHGLSTVDFNVLVRLSRSAEQRLRMSDLAAQTSLSTSGVTRVVDRLEKEGLVARENCPTDRRALFAVLTRDGADRIGGVLPGHVELLQTWLIDPLTESQLAGLLDGLRVVRDTANPGARAGITS
ncbi:MarR family winged helix-turn-helix transcriptional regulator [Embleya sp. NPDC008237]|uniref:MarR family winged helix-turn-helix transcriptional regulator n=1 Tax=unclassified Embleya TaxID=2699296 RepID=UPI0036E88B62